MLCPRSHSHCDLPTNGDRNHSWHKVRAGVIFRFRGLARPHRDVSELKSPEGDSSLSVRAGSGWGSGEGLGLWLGGTCLDQVLEYLSAPFCQHSPALS
jgi:hypothetical protein